MEHLHLLTARSWSPAPARLRNRLIFGVLHSSACVMCFTRGRGPLRVGPSPYRDGNALRGWNSFHLSLCHLAATISSVSFVPPRVNLRLGVYSQSFPLVLLYPGCLCPPFLPSVSGGQIIYDSPAKLCSHYQFAAPLRLYYVGTDCSCCL